MHSSFGSGLFISHKRSTIKRAASGCKTKDLYISPTSSTNVTSSAELDIAWNNTCFSGNPQALDIYLTAPYISTKPIFIWTDVNYAAGSYQAALNPTWWNNTPSVQLELTLIVHGGLPIATEFGPGPVFTVTSDGSNPSASGAVSGKTDNVDNFSHGPTSGGIAAAILVPLFVVVAAAIAFVKWTRIKETKKRKRWSQAVDKRMSTLSTNWQSLSAAGAQAAIRHSIAQFGRPVSAYAAENWRDGAPTGDRPEMQSRPNASRVSRVSFAVEGYGRPSTDTTRAGGARYNFGELPPVPTRQDSETESAISPIQANGAFSLSTDEIRSRIVGHPYANPSANTEVNRESIAVNLDRDLLPALTMMRTGNEPEGVNDFLFSPTSESNNSLPLPPIPAVTATPSQKAATPPPTKAAPSQSPLGMMPLSPVSALSPDQMLRAYAERARTGGNGNMVTLSAPNAPAFPPMAHMNTAPVMRTLYTPGMDMQQRGDSDSVAPTPYSGNSTPTLLNPESNNPFRQSVAPTEASVYSGLDHDYYVGHAS